MFKVAAILALMTGAAAAQNFCFIATNPVNPPIGFGVQDSGLNGSGYYPFDLATSPSANWAINASSNPANEAYLNAFTTSTSGGVTTYSTTSSGTASQGMSVSLAFNSNTGIGTQTISQTGVGSGGCATGEFDLFLSPNSNVPPTQDPTYSTAYRSVTVPTLDKLSRIMISATVTMQSQSAIAVPGACVVNQSAMLYALVFNNATSGQTLFYQLAFNFFCYHGTNSTYNTFCDSEVPSMNYFFTGAGGVWGIDDPINNYSNSATSAPYALLQTATPLDLEINFLPRVVQLIRTGQYGLDTNPAHWSFGSFYYGDHTWGSASLASVWTSINLSPSFVYSPR